MTNSTTPDSPQQDTTRIIKVRHIVSGTPPFACSACYFSTLDVALAAAHDGTLTEETIYQASDGTWRKQ